MDLKKLFENKIVEIFWFSLSLFGVAWFLLTILVFDYQKTPPFLTHINGTISTFVVGAFLVRGKKSDTIIRWFFFPVLATCLCTAIGRMYLDFDCHGSWIVLFHSMRSKYNCAELYRIVDFFSHFLNPIVFLYLGLNNKERIKKIFDAGMLPSFFSKRKKAILNLESIGLQSTYRFTLPILLHSLFPVVIFLCWYTGVYLLGYDPKKLYLIKTADMSDAVMIFFLTPLLLTMPMHYALIQKKYVGGFTRYFDALIFSSAIITCVLAFKIYKIKALFLNTMFIVSAVIVLVFLLKHLKIIKKNFQYLTSEFLVMIGFFFFLIEEFHFWSVGGNESVFLSTLKSHTFVTIHYILKQLFYVFMVFLLYASHAFSYIHKSDKLFLESVTKKNFKFMLLTGCFLFTASYYIGIFRTYDIEHTILDPLWFFLGMLFSLEIVFPMRYLLRISKKSGQ